MAMRMPKAWSMVASALTWQLGCAQMRAACGTRQHFDLAQSSVPTDGEDGVALAGLRRIGWLAIWPSLHHPITVQAVEP